MYKDITKSISGSASRATDEQDASIGRNIELDRMIAEDALDLSKDIPEPEPVVSRDGLPVCTKGNFSVVTGLAKSKKSFLCSAIAGACLADEGLFCGFESKGLDKLVWIDTEMAEEHVAKVARRLHRIAGLKESCSCEEIEIYALRKRTPAERYAMFLRLIETKQPTFAVLDGVADLIDDVNSPEQSTSLITDLLRLTAEYHFHLLVVLHTNEGMNTDKPQGHLGTGVLRKAETVIKVRKVDEGFSSVIFDRTRNQQPSNFSFFIDNRGLPRECEYIDGNFRHRELFEEIMAGKDYWTHTELVNKIKEKQGVSDSTAKRRIEKACAVGCIKMNGKTGSYYLVRNG